MVRIHLEVAMHPVRYLLTFLIAVSSVLLASQEVRAEWSYTIDFESNLSDGTAPADGQIEETGYTSNGYVTARFWTYYGTAVGDSLTSLQTKFPLDGTGMGSHNHNSRDMLGMCGCQAVYG